ncbi:MAG: MATE family efflux transporter [Coxiellaceae bacterium]|nr:MATE family efflux transporter [Coxiellaceae bacterium]
MATGMTSHLGEIPLAASALVWSIYLSVVIFFTGIFFAIGVMIAQSFGAKDSQSISICFKQGIILAILCSIPMMLIMWLSPMILILTKQDPKVITCAKSFFYSLAWSMLPFNILVVIEQFFNGITKTKPVMYISLLSIPIEIFFYYVFLFGKFGFPKTGLAGIGYGLAASYYMVSIFFGCYIYFSKEFKIYALFKKWWILNHKFFKEILRIGLPIGFMYCSELIFFAIITFMMSAIGITTLAAYRVSHQYLMMGLVVLFGIGQAAFIRVGNEVGHNDRNQIRIASAVSFIIALIAMIIFSLFYIVFPEQTIKIIIDTNSNDLQKVIVLIKSFFPIVGLLLLFEAIRFTVGSSLRGLKDTTYQMVISVFGFWLIAFPGAYLLAFRFGYGGRGIWLGILIGLCIIGFAMLMRFNRLVKQVDLLSLVTKE